MIKIQQQYNNNELYHYGVRGMKWGVRRASKKLANATTQKQRDKAIATLNKHKEKATKKVNKLNKSRVQLQKDVDRHIQKTDIKVANLKNRAAEMERKAYGLFTSERKAQQRLYEAGKLNRQANTLEARSRSAKAYLAENEKQTKLFKKGLNDIDKALSNAGRRYING